MKIVVLGLFITLISLQTACNFARVTAEAVNKSTPADTSQQTKGKKDPEKSSGRDEPQYRAYRAQVEQKIKLSDVDWLDSEAKRLQETRERFPGGYWKLRLLFKSLEHPVEGEGAPEEVWEAHLAKLQQWGKERPNSVVANLGLASAWSRFGWKARGKGYAEGVTDGRWNLFGKRLEKASELLTRAEPIANKCPEYYVAALEIALGQGWERDEYERLFERAVATEPNYYYFYQAKSTHLLPRWGGEEGEWERFMETSAHKIGGDDGDIVFYCVYSHMMLLHGLDFMNTHQQQAKRLMRGYDLIVKRYGDESTRLNEACFISVFAGDPTTTSQLMRKIGDNFDESVWRSKENFDVFRQAAYQMEKKAQVSGRAATTSTPPKQ